MPEIQVVPGLQHSEPYPGPDVPMITRDAHGIALAEPVPVPAASDPITMDLSTALAWLTSLAESGVLHGADHLKGHAALDAVQPLLVRLRRALDRIRPTEDFSIGCEKDSEPHALAFHEKHTAEAP
jgi:hypothetical protein